MDQSMIPAGGNPGGGALAPLSQPKGIVAPSSDMMGSGGGGFSETWSINKDEHLFVNKKTGEKRQELYVIIEEMHPSRAYFPKIGPQKGERVCYSDDGKSSYQGIECTSCPHVSEVDAFNKYYEAHQGQQRPTFAGDCSLRYSLYWSKEFIVGVDGSVTLNLRKDRVLLNAPKSSVFAMWSERTGYMKKLTSQGLAITQVVTKIKLAQRKNEDMNSVYDYADFELVGTIENIMPRVTKTVEIASGASSQGAPASSFPGGAPAGLPQMTGGAAPAQAPAATGFPPAATGFPAAAPAAAAPGFPGASAPAAAPGFPSAAPGFPGASAPAAAPAAAPAPAPTAAPQPSFQDMARQKLIQDFNGLGKDVQSVVLNVLGVAKIEDIPNEKVIQASQAVNSAKGFSAPAAVGVGATAGNPF